MEKKEINNDFRLGTESLGKPMKPGTGPSGLGSQAILTPEVLLMEQKSLMLKLLSLLRLAFVEL